MTTTPTNNTASYADRPLDELRMLTDSVETARINEMHTHFSGIATHLNDVIDHLHSLRTDLPHWWTGPASEATLSSFGRVISHAQATQDVASGASQALRLCAQVVGEQQASMGQVPEIGAPVSSGTGFVGDDSVYARGTVASAAAMEHAASYEKAQGRAARIVEGVAAQLVETKRQLAGLMNATDGGFEPASGVASLMNATDGGLKPVSRTSLAKAPTIETFGLSQAVQPLSAVQPSNALLAQLSTPLGDQPPMPRFPTGDPEVQSVSIVTGLPWNAIENVSIDVPWTPLAAATSSGVTESSRTPSAHLAQGTYRPHGEAEAAQSSFVTNATESYREDIRSGTHQAESARSKSEQVKPRSRTTTEDFQHHLLLNDEGYASRSAREPSSVYSATNNSDEPMMGPFGLGSHVTRKANDERGKRPDYLTGQYQNIPKRIVAPPGGLLTPDWAKEL